MAQIDLIIDLIGSPNDKIWPGFSALSIPKSFNLKKQPFNNIAHVFGGAYASTAAVRLLNLLLIFDPRKRATADECLGSSYFKESPLRKLKFLKNYQKIKIFFNYSLRPQRDALLPAAPDSKELKPIIITNFFFVNKKFKIKKFHTESENSQTAVKTIGNILVDRYNR